MRLIILRRIFIAVSLLAFLPLLNAQDRRTIPLDMYLIIDGSSAMEHSRNEIAAWINEQVVNRILMDGDRITIWAAGTSARVIHSATVSGDAGRREIAERLRTLETGGQAADFSGAMTNVASSLTQRAGDRSRLSYTVLIAASAESLQPAFSGNAQHLFRWFRSEQSSRWQALVMAPGIGTRVQQAAAAYMASQR